MSISETVGAVQEDGKPMKSRIVRKTSISAGYSAEDVFAAADAALQAYHARRSTPQPSPTKGVG